MHQLRGTLRPTAPFDFEKTLAFLDHFRPAMGEQRTDAGVLTKAISIDGTLIVFQVQSIGTLDAPELAYILYSESPLDDALHQAMRDRMRFFLSVDDDLRPFYAIGESDPAFEPVMQELYGYHQVKFPTPFESTCWAILSQRNLMSVSRRMKEGLTARFGSALEVEGVLYRAFPEASQLVHLDIDEINAAVGNLWKSQGLSSVARAFDGVDEEWLRAAPYDEVKAWLLGIKAIGAWSASFILLRGMGRMNQLPVGEKWLILAARRFYGNDMLGARDVELLAKPYGEYAGYWAHYLRAAS